MTNDQSQRLLLLLVYSIWVTSGRVKWTAAAFPAFQKGCSTPAFPLQLATTNAAPKVADTATTTSTTENDGWIQDSIEKDSPNLQQENWSSTRTLEARPFPLGLMMDMEEIKRALILAAVNPQMGGVVISGRRGTGKSVMARAVHQLLPARMERVKNSAYNIDPSGAFGVDSILESQLLAENKSISDLETELVPTPFVQIPLNVMEDSLLGTVDLERSIQTGRPEFSPGLLARAHRGILYVDEINLLDEEAANVLLNVVADGYVTIEREGLSLRYPCRPLLLATFNPEEGELREHLLDRIGVALSADFYPLTVPERVQGVDNVIAFSGGTSKQCSPQARALLDKVEQEETELREKVGRSKKLLPEVKIESNQILYLCQEATGAGCEGQRAEIFATEVAKTSAAFEGRTKVNAGDLQLAVLLAIAPRSKLLPEELMGPDDDSIPPPPPELQPLPPPPDQMLDTQREEEEETENEQQPDQTEVEPDKEQDEEEEEEEEEIEIPLEFLFGVRDTPIDPRLLYFNKWTKKGKGRKGSRQFNLERGRFVKAIFPKATKQGKLAVAATLRAAAPFQKLRRLRALGTKKKDKLVYVDKDDFRIKRMAKKSGSLIVFVVDASGSMALNRMDAAKGAALSLLSQAYKCRDKICLITCRGDYADVLVPPTKSMALAKNRLEGMPCGGGTPLSHGLTVAMRAGLNAIKVKQDVGRVVIVLLSDGRANKPFCSSEGKRFDPSVDPDSKEGEPSRKYLKEEVIAVAKKLGALPDFNLLVIDTEDQFVGTGVARDIANAAQGTYFHIIDPGSEAVSRVARSGVEVAKK